MATTHAPRRLTKHELKEDAFSTAVFTAKEWIQANLRTALIVVGGAVVLVAAVWGFLAWRASEQGAAQRLFGQAGVEMRSDNPTAAIAQFQRLLDEHPKASISGLGCFQLAQLQFRQRAFDEARVLYQRYIDDYGGDPMLVAAAWAGMATVDEQAGFYSEAVQKYQNAFEVDKTGFVAAEYVRRAVRAAISANDSSRALALYETLQKEFPKDAANINTAKQALIEHGLLDPGKI